MKKRFIQMREPPYDFIEVSQDYVSEVSNTDSVLWNDRGYNDMKATDGADISSRSKHRQYMKMNNLTTVDDFKDTWKQAGKARDEYRTSGKGGATTRQDVERAVHQLENKRR